MGETIAISIFRQQTWQELFPLNRDFKSVGLDTRDQNLLQRQIVTKLKVVSTNRAESKSHALHLVVMADKN